MPIVDSHCHIYPEKIAGKAVQSVGEFYGIHMDAKGGTAEALIEESAAAPITHHIVHSVATRPDQVQSINDFIAEECRQHPQFIGFMTLHQDMEDPTAEIERAKDMGLCGVKLHPDTQRVNMDDPRLMRIYEAIEGKLPVIMHCGDYRFDYSHPRRMQHILHEFPGLVVDAAHFGGWSVFDYAVEYLENENCFMDISSSQALLGPRRTEELIRIYGTDRILFGSDFPMWSPVDEYVLFTSLGFLDKEFEKMTWHNVEDFLNKEITDVD